LVTAAVSKEHAAVCCATAAELKQRVKRREVVLRTGLATRDS
jgi:hypothetical protein